jgi:hypothetical protein
MEAPGSCPAFLSQAPVPLYDGAVSISTLPRLRMLRQKPFVAFRLQSSRLTSKQNQVIIISMGYIILV